LIGQIWKSGNACRRLVLIARGLDGIFDTTCIGAV
jgi:hypothetical protein